MLLRTLHSVLERSPGALLREVLLVDDSSDDPALSEAVQRHIESRGMQDKVSGAVERTEILVISRKLSIKSVKLVSDMGMTHFFDSIQLSLRKF